MKPRFARSGTFRQLSSLSRRYGNVSDRLHDDEGGEQVDFVASTRNNRVLRVGRQRRQARVILAPDAPG